MKSVKPGRGPSKQAGVMSIFMIVFGVFWCLLALGMGAWFMLPFGCLFIGIACYNAWYSFHNATAEDRYSIVDIVDGDEEADQLNMRYGISSKEYRSTTDIPGTSVYYCPYCGNSVESQFDFCPKCGKKLPD